MFLHLTGGSDRKAIGQKLLEFSWLWDDVADLPQPQDDVGADGEVDDRCEVVDDPGSKVFEMDRSDAIMTEGL